MIEKRFETTSFHQVYKNNKGTRVPGATTVLGSLGFNKIILQRWCVKQALAGIDPFKFVTEAANIGSIAHFMIESHINNWKPIFDKVSPHDLLKAKVAFSAYIKWEKDQIDLKYLKTELQLASDRYNYGGTIDLIAKINGELCLIDFKTSKYFYTEHFCQISAYKELYEECFPKEKIDRCYILKINKETGEFDSNKLTQYKLNKGWEIFKLCLGLHELKGCI